MKRTVYLNQAAIVTGLGALEQTWQALLNKQSAIRRQRHFENALLPQTGLALARRNFADASVNYTQQLVEQCLSGLAQLPPDTWVIWTGIKNNAAAIESRYDGGVIPECVTAHDYRVWVSKRLNLRKGGIEVNAACASSTVGVALAAQYIASGKVDHVLVIGADAVNRFVYYGFAALHAMQEAVCMPFDRNRAGLSLGDGAVALFLSAERGSDLRIAGAGLTNDANHITGPSRDGLGLAEALRQAIENAGVQPEQVGAFCAHGTGTRYNDAMELAAARTLFGAQPPRLFGVKGAIGHTLGAAGGIEIALCGRCLQDGVLIPTVGCSDPEVPEVVLEQTAFAGRYILTSNSGFGGVNAAVLMERL